MNTMNTLPIRKGDRVIILVYAGHGRDGPEWKEKTGRAVMPSGVIDAWVLDMGGPHGTPGVCTRENIVAVAGWRREIKEPTPLEELPLLCSMPSKKVQS